jgi:hypothetical protein
MNLRKVKKAAVYAIAEAVLIQLVYNREYAVYELNGENLFTVAPSVAMLAASELRLQLPESNVMTTASAKSKSDLKV